MKKLLSILLVLVMLASLVGCELLDNFATSPYWEEPASSSTAKPTTTPPTTGASDSEKLDPDEFYYSKEDVALFIHQYGRLPVNFVTKSQAKTQFGSNSKAMQAGYRIGGDTFQNREGRLPAKTGRTYTECDIAPPGTTSRNALRIVFSNDGLVYYTADHYVSFTLLYGEP